MIKYLPYLSRNMSIQHGTNSNSKRAIAVELGFVVAVLFGVYLWRRGMGVVTDPLSATVGSLPTFDGLVVGGLLTGGTFVAGLALFAKTYTASRGIDAGAVLPARTDPTVLGLAGAVPAALVAVTKLVGGLTGVTYASLTMTHYGSGGPMESILAVVGLELLVAVPSLVLVCQVLVQGSFRKLLGGERAVVVTTLVTGVLMRSSAGGLATAPESGKLVGATLLVVVLGVTLYATESVEREGLRYLAYAPVVAFVALVVASDATHVESLAGGLFAGTHLAVLGVAAYVYERSGSLLAPALAYLSLLLANDAVVVVLETGL